MENEYMKSAIEQAKAALSSGEVPVGAVIVKDKKIIAKSYNMRETKNLATAHAEISAIEEACEVLNNWRLDGCSLYVTLEPCIMCTGAIINSRIDKVYFGSYDRENGAFCTANIFNKITLPEYYGGIMEEECDKILNSFFSEIRKRS